MKQQIRASPTVQMDETGWREDGSNGYVWCACTPQLRYYEYQHSRGSEVVKAVLGESFEGVLGSDFYASYNVYTGPHQRGSGASVTRPPELKEQYPDDADVQRGPRTSERSMIGPSPTPGLI